MKQKIEFENLSALEIGSLVRNRKVTAIEVLEYFIRRIERLNPELNAFTYTKFEEARSCAKQLDDRISAGYKAGIFAGVPFALKDFLPSKKGWSASHGGVPSLITIDDSDSEFCKALESADGIAVGKTNAPAFGFRGTCDNVLYGPTKNPFDPTYNSGGSSGGTASALAGGLIAIGEGGDAGGSIRVPAAWCNLFGFKPSAGLIPNLCRPDAWAATHPFCCNGGLTRCVEDAAALLSLMSRYEPRDPLSVDLPKKDYLSLLTAPAPSYRIAVTYDFGLFPVEEEIRKRLDEYVEKLRKLGFLVDFVSFDFHYSLHHIEETWLKSISFDTSIELELMKNKGFDIIKDHQNELPEPFIYWNKRAFESTAMDLYDFNKVRTDVLDAFLNVFSSYDLILSPTTGCLPVKNGRDTLGPTSIDGKPCDPVIGFALTYPINFIGFPAASIPAGLSSSGLPIGLQIVGRKWHDEDVLRLAKSIEDAAPWATNFRFAKVR